MSDQDLSPAEVQRDLEAELIKDGHRLAHGIVTDYWFIIAALLLGAFCLGLCSSGTSVFCCRCQRCERCRKTKCMKSWEHCMGLSGCMVFALGIVAIAVWFLLEDAQDSISLVSGGLLNQCVESLADSLVRNVESTGGGVFGTGSPWRLDLTNPVKEAVEISNLDGRIGIGSSQVATVSLNGQHAPAILEPLVEGSVHIIAFISLIGATTALLYDLTTSQLLGGILQVRVTLRLAGLFGDKSYVLECTMLVPMSTAYLPSAGSTSGSIEERLEQWAEALLEPNDEALPLKLSFIHGLRSYERTGETMMQFSDLNLSGSVTTSAYIVFGTLILFLCVITWMIGEICGRTCIDQGADEDSYARTRIRRGIVRPNPKFIGPGASSHAPPPYYNQTQRFYGQPAAPPHLAGGFTPTAPPLSAEYAGGSWATGPPATGYGAPVPVAPPSKWSGNGDHWIVPGSSAPGVPASQGPVPGGSQTAPRSGNPGVRAPVAPPSTWSGKGDHWIVPQSSASGMLASQGPVPGGSWTAPRGGNPGSPDGRQHMPPGPASWTAPGPGSSWPQSGGVPPGPASWQGAPQGYSSWQGPSQGGSFQGPGQGRSFQGPNPRGSWQGSGQGDWTPARE